jgi:hypothetical protein
LYNDEPETDLVSEEGNSEIGQRLQCVHIYE